MTVTQTLRHRIRTDTAAHHAKVDACYGTLDLTQPGDYGHFLSSHLAGFTAVAVASPTGPARNRLNEMIVRLDADARRLGVNRSAVTATMAPLDEMAVAYVTLGSQMGSAVLRKDWVQATDPTVRAADQYFGMASDHDSWRTLCATLTATSATGAAADRIVADTVRIFDQFQHAFRAAAPSMSKKMTA